ncbi:hypothetical protein OH77DRAFT_1427620 [Trametes cingulata]|nr:hypothetical protein OH77DRAFT_1427620 [Trametes cingulata]
MIGTLNSFAGVHLIAQSRDEFLEGERVLYALIAQLRRCLNATVSVERLPPEILLRIFEYATCQGGPQGRRSYLPRSTLKTHVSITTLATLTHVCKRWRDIALKSSHLWAYTDDRDLDRLDAFLTRSQAAPLFHHCSTAKASAIDNLLGAHGHRLRRLDIVCAYNMKLRSLFKSEMPLLECLTIVSVDEFKVTSDSLMPTLFRTPTPLRALALLNADSWLPADHFPNLTHLHLSVRFREDEEWMSYLLALLSHTPALQFVHLAELQTLDENQRRDWDVVPLRSLHSFRCTSYDVKAALVLLGLLEMPQDVVVQVYWPWASGAIGPPLLQPLHLQALFAGFTRLEISSDLAGDPYLLAEGSGSGSVCVHAEYAGRRAEQWMALLRELFVATGLLTCVTTLVLRNRAVYAIPDVLCHLPQLTVLEVITKCTMDMDMRRYHVDWHPVCQLWMDLYAALTGGNGVSPSSLRG